MGVWLGCSWLLSQPPEGSPYSALKERLECLGPSLQDDSGARARLVGEEQEGEASLKEEQTSLSEMDEEEHRMSEGRPKNARAWLAAGATTVPGRLGGWSCRSGKPWVTTLRSVATMKQAMYTALRGYEDSCVRVRPEASGAKDSQRGERERAV